MKKQVYLQLDLNHFALLHLNIKLLSDNFIIRSAEWINLDDADQNLIDELVGDYISDLTFDSLK